MKTLESIKTQHERIVSISVTGDYCQYNLLMDNEIHSLEDISQILEYTLRRMVDVNFSQEEVRYNSGMYIPTPEELQELEEYDEFTHIDLGYVLGGLILNIE